MIPLPDAYARAAAIQVERLYFKGWPFAEAMREIHARVGDRLLGRSVICLRCQMPAMVVCVERELFLRYGTNCCGTDWDEWQEGLAGARRRAT